MTINVPGWTSFEWVMVFLGAASLIVAILILRISRGGRDDINRAPPRYYLFSDVDSSKIQSTSGIPTLPQLTERMELDSKRRGSAERLYEIGLAQFNHHVNNQDGVLEASRQCMASLANSLSQSELALAESIGVTLASDCADDQKVAVQPQYDDLTPQAQIYAQQRRMEVDALKRIARDLEKNVPRTDYTSVKARIASGAVSLDSIMSELPIPWQAIRTLNERVERRNAKGKPPKRKFLHVSFLTATGELEDRRAERDGDWIVSTKHGLTVPYQEPIPIYEMRAEGKLPVQMSEVIVISSDPTSEWETEFWRQGGRLDQTYLRAKNGQSPEQLRSAYRRRIVRKVGWALAGTAGAVDIVIIATRFF